MKLTKHTAPKPPRPRRLAAPLHHRSQTQKRSNLNPNSFRSNNNFRNINCNNTNNTNNNSTCNNSLITPSRYQCLRHTLSSMACKVITLAAHLTWQSLFHTMIQAGRGHQWGHHGKNSMEPTRKGLGNTIATKDRSNAAACLRPSLGRRSFL
mmetsp:Transcript_3105/g.6833  ORF Transcript_3105/g.6833 Transcript_3105/m.6833 type:complete len:152 (+) Transcript_3105:2649-3104(+)